MDGDLEEKRLTCRSYLEMLVDALMMMIPSIPINLTILKQVLCPVFAQGSQCAFSPTQQMSTISDLLCHEKEAI